ncbi:ankyrin repeat domain-containing protein [Aquimarina algicola]|uniref:Uncharacterized protein n=1 Tax=Aquimarina algicola TaxID=2589995 RepID=A0A504J662_9FLAO|nr:hypothetical protein [Aquimarina algicola]TPN86287.1 hypothetical protein FHK87_13555 [Aquimarina algicola]
MDYYFLDTYGNRNEYISVENNFFSGEDKDKRVYQYGNQYIYEKNALYEKSNPDILLTDLYSDREHKANWNEMFAAAQLDEYPENQKKWGDVLGCTGELIVNEKIKNVLYKFYDKNSTECIRIGLRDTMFELPTNYFLINPLLKLDVLNYQASEFTFFFDESQSNTEEIILDSHKLEDIPDVFRIKHESYQIVISQTVADALKNMGVSNLRMEQIPQLPKENSVDDEKYKLNTALFSASNHDKFERVKSMIERGGDINYKNSDGISTLEILIEKKQTELINLFNSLNVKE